MASTALTGKKIVITRAAEQSEELISLLENYGAIPVLYSTIKTVPLYSDKISAVLRQLESYDWIILSSTNAVKYFINYLENLNLEITNQKLFPVGIKTAEMLKNKGLTSEPPPSKYSANGLIDTFNNLNCMGKKILIPRAKKGNEFLPKVLEKLGAQVEILAIYETVIPSADEVGTLPENVDVITFTSPSAFYNFEELTRSRFQELMKNSITVAIGTVTAMAMKKRGIEPDVTGKVFTIEGMIESLISFL